MNRRQFLTATGVASITTLAGCGGDGGGQSTPTPEPESISVTVEISDDETFDPPVVAIRPGESVEWENTTEERRRVRANTEIDRSSEWNMTLELQPGESKAFTFDEEGVYSYHEPTETWFLMCGAVMVGDVEAVQPSELPCERTLGTPGTPVRG
ncbi:MAG: plastocyanin/azurin family copper-binding protein [Haloarculaceae archaeon]